MISNEKSPNHKVHYDCDVCKYKTRNKTDYLKHENTKKHKNAILAMNRQCFAIKNLQKSPNDVSSKNVKDKTYICQICSCTYYDYSGLWRHKKKCNDQKIKLEIENNFETDNNISNATIICELMKQNNEFKEMLVEQNNKIMEMVKEGKYITNNSTTNNNFNLNLFLNEKCKNAINIMDFINTLQVQLQDLENTGKLGYVQGITRIFIRGLLELDVYKRPIHCSDLKRETIYVKDKDVWEKEDKEKGKIKLAIKYIADKNMRQLSNWVKENPESKDIESKKHVEYMKIINKLTGGMTTDEDEDNYNKIIKNVSKEIVIGKDN